MADRTPTFQEWMDDIFDGWEDEMSLASLSKMPVSTLSPILWLHGCPGTGKSVATAHVIRYVQSCNSDCSFYFFRPQDKAFATVASLLGSLAFQMAECSVEIRRAIVSMAEDDVRINFDDHYVLWTTLFVERIFKAEYVGHQYWVIDAIDECSSKTMPALISMLSHLNYKIPVRAFISSRPRGGRGVGRVCSIRLKNLNKASHYTRHFFIPHLGGLGRIL